jgi:SAM-dependent methyltransferase
MDHGPARRGAQTGGRVPQGLDRMPRAAPFDVHHRRYEDWFASHEPAYQSELLAVRALLPWRGRGLEIGAGSGRFAGPLGVRVGMDPSPAMLRYATARGVLAVQGVAEALPFRDAAFDYALIVTTLCFVDDAKMMLSETRRVLTSGGSLVIGFIDRASALGRDYLTHRAEHVFYRKASFYSAAEVDVLLRDIGFENLLWAQTVSVPPEKMREAEPVRPGTGTGAFVVVRATRS